jgi:hypothetical protein
MTIFNLLKVLTASGRKNKYYFPGKKVTNKSKEGLPTKRKRQYFAPGSDYE